MKQFVSAMFLLMAGAVFADTVSVVALDAKIRSMMDENMTAGMSVVGVNPLVAMPEDHPRVSDATPYSPKRKRFFATKAEVSPWATVELAGSVEITGVTVLGDADTCTFFGTFYVGL